MNEAELEDVFVDASMDYDVDDDDDACESDISDDDCFDDQWEDDYELGSETIDEDTEPLYPGAAITLGTFMLLLAVFCTKHSIIGDGVQQLLQIISLVLPNEHKLCTTLYAYKKYFKNLKNPLVYHYYCKHCMANIEDLTKDKCDNNFCQQPFDKTDKTYFLEMPIINQLKNMFSVDGFFESLQHRFKRTTARGTYADIYDGILHKNLSKDDGPLNSPNNISFTFNTDGAPVFKSSNVSIWPIYLVVNELPYRLRMKKENMILASLWFGSKKPSMSTFLKPFLKSMKELSNGVECHAPTIGKFICKGFLLCGTTDLPARSMICNCMQYNGAFSCWKCMQEGKTAKVGKGHTRVFPFNDDDPKGPQRSHDSVKEDAKAFIQAKIEGSRVKSIRGIKGPSWLMLIPRFTMVHGISIDYMHGVLLGVQKLLLRLWFKPEFSKERFSFSKSVSVVDKKLLSITPTLDITRLPRKIESDLKHWKASEYRSFLLYYGAIVLKSILDQQRFCHYLLLVNAMHILLKCGSREEDLEEAESMLINFCKHFAELYSECYLTLNVHQLVHLADSVRYLGPLYTHSCFSFEDKNGIVLKMIKGTQGIDNQIITGVSFLQKLPELRQKCIIKGSREEKLYNSIDAPYILKRNLEIAPGIFVLGAIKNKQKLKEDEFQSMVTYLEEMPTTDEYSCFNRIEIKSMVIYGINYKRMSKRDNSGICYTFENKTEFGRVRSFLILKNKEGESTYLAITEILSCINFNANSGIIAVKSTSLVRMVPIQEIKCTCMFVKERTRNYVCLFPNTLESD